MRFRDCVPVASSFCADISKPMSYNQTITSSSQQELLDWSCLPGCKCFDNGKLALTHIEMQVKETMLQPGISFIILLQKKLKNCCDFGIFDKAVLGIYFNYFKFICFH